jgi:predicted metal-dependent peptidase
MSDIIRKGRKPGKVFKAVIAIDVSGSVSNEDARMLLSQVSWLLHKQNAVVTLMLFDTAITKIKELKKLTDLEEFKTIEGRGGTSYKPVFEWAKENDAHEVIIMTDGYGDQEEIEKPFRDMRVWWLATNPGPTYPFGKKLDIDK